MECYEHGHEPDRKCKVCRVLAAQRKREAEKAEPEDEQKDQSA